MWRNKKRTIIQLALALSAVMLLAGCTKGGQDTDNEMSNAGKKRKAALIAKSTTSAFWKSVYSGSNAASTAYNMEVLFEGPEKEEDYETQNQMIERAVADGYEAIVFSAVDYRKNAAAVNAAAEKGVKIVGIDSDVDSDAVSCRIGTDNYNAGCVAGKAVLESKEDILYVGIVNFEKSSENGQERERGFLDTVKRDERIRIVESINVISTTEEAKKGTLNLLDRHPQINTIVTFNEWTSLGVGYAIKEKELGEKMHVVAFDSNVVSVGMLETGEVDALIVQNPYAMGYLGIETAYNLLNGTAVEKKRIDTETICVTRENMYDDECQKLLFAFE